MIGLPIDGDDNYQSVKRLTQKRLLAGCVCVLFMFLSLGAFIEQNPRQKQPGFSPISLKQEYNLEKSQLSEIERELADLKQRLDEDVKLDARTLDQLNQLTSELSNKTEQFQAMSLKFYDLKVKNSELKALVNSKPGFFTFLGDLIKIVFTYMLWLLCAISIVAAVHWACQEAIKELKYAIRRNESTSKKWQLTLGLLFAFALAANLLMFSLMSHGQVTKTEEDVALQKNGTQESIPSKPDAIKMILIQERVDSMVFKFKTLSIIDTILCVTITFFVGRYSASFWIPYSDPSEGDFVRQLKKKVSEIDVSNYRFGKNSGRKMWDKTNDYQKQIYKVTHLAKEYRADIMANEDKASVCEYINVLWEELRRFRQNCEMAMREDKLGMQTFGMIGAKISEIEKQNQNILGLKHRKLYIGSFDIDKFKYVNNAYDDNYDKADQEVLMPFAEELKRQQNKIEETKGGTDIVEMIHFHGDEFIILATASNDENAETLFRKIHKVISGTVPYRQIVIDYNKKMEKEDQPPFCDKITVSLGVAPVTIESKNKLLLLVQGQVDHDVIEWEEAQRPILAAKDMSEKLCMNAKNAGRNKVSFSWK